jgi:signal transduction histidine kinase
MARSEKNRSAGDPGITPSTRSAAVTRGRWPAIESTASFRKKVAETLRLHRDAILGEWKSFMERAREETGEEGRDPDLDLGVFFDCYVHAIESSYLTELHRVLGQVAERRWQLWQLAVTESGRTALIVKQLFFGALEEELTHPDELMEAVRIIDATTTEVMYTYIETYQALAADELERQARRLARAERERAFALERQRMREKVLHSERLAAIGRMAARVAHDVRSPLNAISLNVELLTDAIASGSGDGAGEAGELLGSIDAELERLNDLVEEYLRFMRFPETKLEHHDVAAVLGDLLDFLEGEMAGNGIHLERRFCDGLPSVLLDRRKLRQACLNLFKNSVEAMPEGGEIVTEIGEEDGHIAIRISDTGLGISDDQLGVIFRPFASTKEGGTGLGVPIAQEIVAEHGGTISCQSRVGEGTTFLIRLPVARPASGPEAENEYGSAR